MKVIYSIKGVAEKKRPRQGCNDMKKAGISEALLQFPALCNPLELEQEKEPTEELFSQMTMDLLRCGKDSGVTFPIAYAPHFLRGKINKEDMQRLEKQILKCFDICIQAGIKTIIVRPLDLQGDEKFIWEENRRFYLALYQKAEKYEIKICLENQCKDINGHLVRGICAEPEQAVKWIDSLNEEVGKECFGFCLNVGTANLCGQNMYEMLRVLDKRVDAVVVTDCNGFEESALLPFSISYRGQSKTDWLSLIRGLREIEFDGNVILDFSDTATVSTPMLRPHLLQLVKETGEYFKWQLEMETLIKKYPCRVLFGAGNMCRNYMKCYGDKYPPLFTCDNNSSLWGTVFEGVQVMAPETLKKLPKDCAIFICNMYYREIEQQLKQMGVDNPIEFFSDEYMPSYYFNRI